MSFLADLLQNTSNAASNIGIATPEFGWTEMLGGANVKPNHVQNAALDFTKPIATASRDTGVLGDSTVKDVYTAEEAAQARATAQARANNLSQYDQAIGTYNSSLGRLDNQLGIARGNINQQYGTQQNELNTNKAAQQATYGNQTTQNSQNLRSNKNVIADQASAGLRGLQRMLGAYGAGGSSDALYVAPQAVADQASQQRAGAGQTFAQNQSGLDTNWNNFLNEDTNNRKKLDDWKSNTLNQVESTSQSTRQDLLTKLAGLQGQRAAAAGGSYAASAQPYLDQAGTLNSTIDNLGRSVATYDGTKAVYQAPTLDSYQSQAASAKMDPTQTAGGNNPYLSLLLGQNKDKTKALF